MGQKKPKPNEANEANEVDFKALRKNIVNRYLLKLRDRRGAGFFAHIF